MFKTRMTQMFGIEHPIMLAGMNWITEPKLVAAVCNAGGAWTFSDRSLHPERNAGKYPADPSNDG